MSYPFTPAYTYTYTECKSHLSSINLKCIKFDPPIFFLASKSDPLCNLILAKIKTTPKLS